MRKINANLFSLKFLLASVIFISVFASLISADIDRYALVLQRSPAHGGDISPGSGIKFSEMGEVVKIVATPKTGYQFVYWLGEVTDPTNNITSVLVESPMMVIAVFKREESKTPAISGSSSGVNYSAARPRSMPGAGRSSGGYTPPSKPPVIIIPPPPPEEPPTDPPDEPIPEPGTLLLFSGGVVIALGEIRRRRDKFLQQSNR